MLHLPMEPMSYPDTDPGRGAVLSGMPAGEVRRTVLSGLAAVPHVRGVNNHMGSRVTSNTETMRAVMDTLASTSHFFIDSRTIETSVALQVARERKIPSAERSIFLDDDQSKAAIRRQLRQLVGAARRDGSAIAIGHPHDNTLEVLAVELPELERQGLELVFVSELVL